MSPRELDVPILVDEQAIAVGDDVWFDLSFDAPPVHGGPIEASVGAHGPVATLRLEAVDDLAGLATGRFHLPSVCWRVRPRLDVLQRLGVRSFGYQYMEFALPSTAGPKGHGLAPWPPRPPVAFPIVWQGPDTPALLVGPVDRFHDQIVAVSSNEHPRDDLAAGWHGDLAAVPAGFATTLAVLVESDVRSAIARYGELVRARHRTQRTGHGRDPAVRDISYWTDNGAHYYYRSEEGMDYPATLEAALARLVADGLHVGAVQLDSWWYPHEQPRGLDAGATVVPPSGAMRWDAREDALPGGFDRVRDAVGGRPLVLHSRHLSARSPYFDDGGSLPLVDDTSADGSPSGHAHPATTELVDAWMEQAAIWGACTYEQDWLVETFLTVDGLRRTPGAGDEWQREMDRSAARRGLTLQFCMATPADFLHTARMTQVSSIRTSMDFQYAVGRQANWGWFLHVNALARALDLATSKDVFIAARRDDGTGWEDPLAGAEALLAAMSCGPVGFGDRIGATDRDLVLRTCREDGVIVMPDVPIAALARSFLGEPMGTAAPLLGEAYTDHPAGRWHYVASFAEQAVARVSVTVGIDELDHRDTPGPLPEQWIAHRFGTGETRVLDVDGRLELTPGDEAFDLWTIAPALLDGRVAVFGDGSKYVAAGTRRIGRVTEDRGGLVGTSEVLSCMVFGAPGTTVDVAGWHVDEGFVSTWHPDGITTHPVEPGRWTVPVVIGPNGWTRVGIRPER
jgi:hypothetical protein